MKTFRLALVVALLITVIAGVGVSIPRSSAQDGMDPATVVAQMTANGLIPTADGMLAATDVLENVDLSNQNNLTNWRRGLGFDEYVDFVAGATISWGPGATEDVCGFVFRQRDSGNYYMAGINRDGMLRVLTQAGGAAGATNLHDVAAINVAEDATNDLVIAATGTSLVALVNGTVAAQWTAATHQAGKVSVAMTTFDNSGQTYCLFRDAWIWDQGGAVTVMAPTPTPIPSPTPAESPTPRPVPTEEDSGGRRPADGDGDDEDDAQADPPPTARPNVTQLTHYAEGIGPAVAELEELGVIPSGGTEIFREPMAYFEGTGNWFTALARYKPFTHIVMAGELEFQPSDTEEIESCSLISRINTEGGSATSFLEVGITNSGVLIVLDVVDREVVTFIPSSSVVDFGEPQHILFTALRGEVSVYLNGRRVLTDVAVDERAGTYGIALKASGAGARCEGHDLWAWEVDDVVAFEGGCGVRAPGNVNLREGPGTNFASPGTLDVGSTAMVVGQTTGADGYVWYKLDNDSWVRSDVISVGGNCTNVPEVNE
ncbi:MAG: SH3 domain-containing protein [Anaerolineae bacterium]|nr:SH3 domain-containing protein [Anaerolineae bacterium]